MKNNNNSTTKNLSRNKTNQLIDCHGKEVSIPNSWIFLPAGDAGLTRKITQHNEYYRLVFQKGRRTISKGIWAPKHIVENETVNIKKLRESDQYKKQTAYSKQYRAKKENEYQLEFFRAIMLYLNFHPQYKKLEYFLAKLICQHAIPVGSGTVARTKMIPIEERASKAVIAWMRHQTTAYDNMNIPRIKGERRMVRRELAKESVKILEKYRNGENATPSCPIQKFIYKKAMEERKKANS